MTHRVNHRAIICLLSCALMGLLTPAPLLAEETAERWFAVELLIFSNNGADSNEHWPSRPVLVYPEAARFLVDVGEVAANRRHYAGTSIVDEFGRQLITLPPQPPEYTDASEAATDILAYPAPDAVAQDTLEPNAPVVVAVDPNSPTAAADDPNEPQPKPKPFTLRPRKALEFGDRAAAMERSGRYHVLLHQAWAQPVKTRKDALPIVLDRSGDSQDWPVLQGSIKLYLERYLHLKTNLWLNRRGGYLPPLLPMPAPPLGPVSVIVEPAAPLPADHTLQSWQEQVPKAALTTIDDAATFGTPDSQHFAPAITTYEALLPVYPYRYAVLMQQHRRMRSNEVHYIDHPLFGLLIKILPLDGDQLALLAAEQAEAEAEAEESVNQGQ